jgi:uncharacterized protein
MGGNALFLAFALMLIMEGLLPFVVPALWREIFRKAVELNDGQIRFFGLSAILAGLALLYLFN